MVTDLQQFENFLKNLFFNSGTTKDFFEDEDPSQ